MGAATYHGAAARRRGRRRSERARSPARGGPEAAGGGGEGGRSGEGASAPGRGRAAPAPRVRRTLPSARLPRPRAPPAPQAAGLPGSGCGSSIPCPARASGGRASGRSGGSWGPGRARGGLSGSTFSEARARSHTRTHTRRGLRTLAARASFDPTRSPRTLTRADQHTRCLQRVTDTACGCHPDTRGPTRTAYTVSRMHTLQDATNTYSHFQPASVTQTDMGAHILTAFGVSPRHPEPDLDSQPEGCHPDNRDLQSWKDTPDLGLTHN